MVRRRLGQIAIAAALAAGVVPARAATVTVSANLVPSRGSLLGAYVDPDARWSGNLAAQAEVTAFETSIGRQLDINQHYYSWTDVFPSGLEQWDVIHGRIPLITWEPWGVSLPQITSGQFDSLIKSRAQSLKRLGSPVFLRWGHEMNGNWYPWSGSSNGGGDGGPNRYVAAYRHIHDLFEDEGASNVVWVWSPNADTVPKVDWNHWSNYYPGDAYVDWVGPDGYNWGSTRTGSSWRSFRTIFLPIYNEYAGRKPLMISETASVEEGGNKHRWIAGMWTQIQEYMTEIKALVYFNVGPGWSTSSSSAAHKKFAAMANSPHFLQVSDISAPTVSGMRVAATESVGVTFTNNEPARLEIKVRSEAGSLIKELRGGRRAKSPVRRLASWSGRDLAGRVVEPGRYQIQVTAIDAAGHRSSRSQWVEVTRG